MEPPPDEPNNDATLVGLAAAILLVALAVWLLVAFKHSSDTLDCLAAASPRLLRDNRQSSGLALRLHHCQGVAQHAMPASSRVAFSLRWRRKARAPGRPLNRPSICLVMLLQAHAFGQFALRHNRNKPSTALSRSRGVAAEKARIDLGQHGGILIGGAAQHHAVETGQMRFGFVQMW